MTERQRPVSLGNRVVAVTSVLLLRRSPHVVASLSLKKGTGGFSHRGMTIVNPSWKKAPMPSGKSGRKQRCHRIAAVYSAERGCGPGAIWGAHLHCECGRSATRRQANSPLMPEKSPNSGKTGSRAGGSVRVTGFQLGAENGSFPGTWRRES